MLIRSSVIIGLLSFLQYGVAQTIHHARCIQGDTRFVWVIGRELWTGNEHLYDPKTNTVSASIEGTACSWDLLQGANNEEVNRAWPYAQRFSIPELLPAGQYVLTHIRNDGKVSQTSVDVPAVRSLGKPLILAGVDERDGPVIVPHDQTLDLGGKVLMPSAKYSPINSTQAFVTMEAGSSLVNGGVHIPEGHRSLIKHAVYLLGSKHTIANVSIANLQTKGYGVFVDDTTQSQFVRVNVQAYRTWENDPRDTASGNTWYQCDNTGLRLGRDSQIGRGICGARNLIVNCSWHDMDRGATGSQYGSPMDQITFYECHQYNTGRSILGDGLKDAGASEGTLIETASNYLGDGQCGGNVCVITSTSNDDKLFIRPGYHVCVMGPNVWARITTINSSAVNPSQMVLTLDRQIPIGNFKCRIGNLVCECNYLRCQFEHGRAGIWLHGASVGTAIIQCDFIDLRHAGIVKLVRDRPGMQCFHWGLDAKYLSAWNTANLWRDYTP